MKRSFLFSTVLALALTACGETAPVTSDDGWRELTIASDGCMGYDGQAFAVPASVSMPIPTSCNGRYRLLVRDEPTVGYEFNIVIPNAAPSDIPEAWRHSRPIPGTDWFWDGVTEIPYAGQLHFRLLDEFGFEIASLSGDEVQISSGQTNNLRGTLTLTEAQVAPLRSIEATINLTRCFLCDPPQRE